MYQSHLEDRKRQAVLSPQDDNDMDETAKLHSKFINKERGPIKSNGNISHKRGAVSFNIGRIIPRNITHDKQFLYEENMKLKESVQQFREEVIKLRTRLSVSEKQKIKIADEFNNSELPNKNSSSRINRRHGSMTYSNIQNQNCLKKMLRQGKDEVNLLKIQNARLKKTVKYTQITELQIQNKYLLEECKRLNNIIESKILDQNQFIDEYQIKINELRLQLQNQRDNTRNITNQSKKKIEEIESLKYQINEMNLREKKLKRQLNDYKKTPSAASKIQTKSFKNEEVKALKTNEDQTKKLKTIEKSPVPSSNTKNDNKINNSFQNEQIKKVRNSDKKSSIVKIDTENDTNKNGKSQKQIQSKPQKDIEVDDEKYDDEFQGKQKENSKDNDEEYGQDNFDDDQPETKKQDNKHKQEKSKEDEKDEYQDQFDQVQDDKSQKQEILFDKSKKSVDKQEVLKQTITYRLMSQRYTYQDLQSDIKQSGMKDFTLEQIASMLSDEPFFLTQEQIQWLLSFIFQRDDLHLEEKVKTKEFVTKIKPFIGDFTLLSEQKEQQSMQNCVQFLQKNKKQLKKKFKQHSDSNKCISKNAFIQIFKAFKLTKDQINILLGQAALVSMTINQINYEEFLNKLGQ